MPATNKIIVGSFEGYLRIFNPRKGDYHGDHLLIEQNFNDGILQVSLGTYGDSNDLLLAVLHSRMLAVYYVETSNDTTQLILEYKHELARNSFNFTQGNFGKAPNEMI